MIRITAGWKAQAAVHMQEKVRAPSRSGTWVPGWPDVHPTDVPEAGGTVDQETRAWPAPARSSGPAVDRDHLTSAVRQRCCCQPINHPVPTTQPAAPALGGPRTKPRMVLVTAHVHAGSQRSGLAGLPCKRTFAGGACQHAVLQRLPILLLQGRPLPALHGHHTARPPRAEGL